MKIKGGIASKNEAVVDSEGRLLVDVEGAGGGGASDPIVTIAGNGTYELNALAFEDIGAPVGPVQATALVAGRYIISYQVSVVVPNAATIDVSARITVNTVAVPDSEIVLGHMEATAGIANARHANNGIVMMDLAVGDVVEIQARATSAVGATTVASFNNTGKTSLKMAHYG